MARGKPFERGNTFGRGRPLGSRNKTTIMAKQLFESHAEPVVRKAIVMALQGHPTALKLCMDRIDPLRRDPPVNIGFLPSSSAEEISQSAEKVVRRVAAGKLSPAQGAAMADLLEK